MQEDQFDLYHFVITKEDIDNFEFDNILGALNKLHRAPHAYFNKIMISIYGYESDIRELYQIEEVRDYLRFLDYSFPHWFYYSRKDIPRNASLFSLMITAICEWEKIGDNSIQINNDSLASFLINHYSYMNKLMLEMGHSVKEIKEISTLIESIIFGN